jgi:hypothetical protein
MDALFAEANKYKLTVPTPVAIEGKMLRGKNELPLISQSVANAITTVAWGLSSPRGQANIQKSIERSVNRKYLPYMNSIARANSKSMHHLYEWNKIGQTSARLFDLSVPASSRGKASFSMKVTFRPSKSLVPLTEAQMTPNPFTGAVVQKKHIFFNKAMVMEYGESVTIRPKFSKYLAFDTPANAPYRSLSGLTFTSKPININYSMRPNFHGLQMATASFFNGVGGIDAGEAAHEYSRKVTRGAQKSAHMISVSVPSDAYAKTIANRVTNALVP